MLAEAIDIHVSLGGPQGGSGWLPGIVRWVHITSAIAALGGPFFVRFGLMPVAAKVLDGESHLKLRDALNARWRHIVYTLITLLILTGLYNFLVTSDVHGMVVTGRWREFSPESRRLYHAIFGIKMLAAFAIFFIASVLPGRTATFEPMRKNAKLWVTILLLLGAVVIACSNALRMIH